MTEDPGRRQAPSVPALDGGRLGRTLQRTGWVRLGGRADLYERWALPDDRESSKLLLPLDPERQDYDDLLADAWRTVSNLALRSTVAQASVAVLTRAPGDEVLFRKEALTVRGAVAWPDGEDLILSARNTLVAAAKTRLSRRSYYAQRHGRFAKRFLESVLMGQTQVGSYVVTAYTPVDEIFEERPSAPSAPMLQTANKALFGYRGREITLSLISALRAVDEAADHFARTASLSGFDEGVRSGVSRELTDALRGILRHSDSATVSVDWSPEGQQELDMPSDLMREPQSVSFEASVLPVLERASNRLATLTASEFVTVIGWVSVVSRPNRRVAGVIRLRVVRGSVARTLSVRLSNEQYQVAAAAVTDNALLRVSGRQEKEGSRFWLYDASDIVVIEAPPTNALPPRGEQLEVDVTQSQ